MGVLASNRAGPVEQTEFFDEFERMLGTVDARPRVVVDRDMRVVWQSENAAELLSAPVPLHISAGTVAADTRAANAALSDFIHNLNGDCDSVLLRAHCVRDGARRIGFGDCEGTVLPARTRP